MKKDYKKTMWASIITFALGTSCCWISALVIWIGGASIIGVVSKYLPTLQFYMIVLGIILGLITLYLYKKR